MINLINLVDDFTRVDLSSPKKIKEAYRRFMMMGFTKIEASNMVASLLGLDVCKTGWTVKQFEDLLFIKYMKENKDI